MADDFTPTLEGYTGQSKLRFWCQKVLPLVYDDSLSYYELLNKVVLYLNNTIEDVSACEDNIVALRDAFVNLQEYVNDRIDDFASEVEQIIDDMIDSGEFDEILANVVNGLIANEYSTTQGYAQFDYVLKDGKLYCATASTSGEWDETKWRETTVGADMQLLNQRVYNLNAGQVAFNGSAEYGENTVGKKLQELDEFDDSLNAGQVGYNNAETYDNNTVGKELQNVNDSLKPITLSSYADITAFLNTNYDGFTRLCYVPATFMAILSRGKNNAIGIGYVTRTTTSAADFFLRTGYDKIWTIRVSNGATTYVTSFLNSNLITPYYEPSYNSSRAYAIGDIVNIANSELVRITSAISSGTAFVVGTNCVSITITDEINSTTILTQPIEHNTDSSSPTTAYMQIYYYKWKHFCQLYIMFLCKDGFQSGSANRIVTVLPSSIPRPKRTVSVTDLNLVSMNYYTNGTIRVQNNGTPFAANTGPDLSISFFTD